MRDYNYFIIDVNSSFLDHRHLSIRNSFYALYIDCIGILKKLDTNEIDEVINFLNIPNPHFCYWDKVNEDIPFERIAICVIKKGLYGIFIPFHEIVNVDITNTRLLEIYPELGSVIDKNGLIVLNNDKGIYFGEHSGYITYKNHILYYNQLLGREFSGNPNFDFINRFLNYYKINNRLVFSISLDLNRICELKDFRRLFELDAWYGPPFDEQRIDDPYYVGLTTKIRNKKSVFEMTNKLDRTEFYWKYNKNEKIKEFEIEEVSDCEYQFGEYNLNKYIHSLRDVKNKTFTHLDGSVNVYNHDTYYERFDRNNKIPRERKSYKHIKLFRIENYSSETFSLQDWTDLISLFFKSNEMVLEYFNLEEYMKAFTPKQRGIGL